MPLAAWKARTPAARACQGDASLPSRPRPKTAKMSNGQKRMPVTRISSSRVRLGRGRDHAGGETDTQTAAAGRRCWAGGARRTASAESVITARTRISRAGEQRQAGEDVGDQAPPVGSPSKGDPALPRHGCRRLGPAEWACSDAGLEVAVPGLAGQKRWREPPKVGGPTELRSRSDRGGRSRRRSPAAIAPWVGGRS